MLGISRAGYYYEPEPPSERDVFLTKRIDEIYTEFPYYGSPKITAQLKREDIAVNHKAVERLMRIIGISAICPTKFTSRGNKQHYKYPYLLKGITIARPDQVWGTDITYIRANGFWFYLTAIMDWHSRYVISWRLSRTLASDFCVISLQNALDKGRIPEIHNSDQGVQFTSEDYTSVLKEYPQIKISMDGRGRCFDNIFTERLWRNVKYEEVYLKDYQSFEDALQSLTEYFYKYNNRRLHESLGYKTPAEIYFQNEQQKNRHILPEKLQTNPVEIYLKNTNLLSR